MATRDIVTAAFEKAARDVLVAEQAALRAAPATDAARAAAGTATYAYCSAIWCHNLLVQRYRSGLPRHVLQTLAGAAGVARRVAAGEGVAAWEPRWEVALGGEEWARYLSEEDSGVPAGDDAKAGVLTSVPHSDSPTLLVAREVGVPLSPLPTPQDMEKRDRSEARRARKTCQGTNKDGQACKNKISRDDKYRGFCHLHQKKVVEPPSPPGALRPRVVGPALVPPTAPRRGARVRTQAAHFGSPPARDSGGGGGGRDDDGQPAARRARKTCQGTNKDGQACKNKISRDDKYRGFCHLHQKKVVEATPVARGRQSGSARRPSPGGALRPRGVGPALLQPIRPLRTEPSRYGFEPASGSGGVGEDGGHAYVSPSPLAAAESRNGRAQQGGGGGGGGGGGPAGGAGGELGRWQRTGGGTPVRYSCA